MRPERRVTIVNGLRSRTVSDPFVDSASWSDRWPFGRAQATVKRGEARGRGHRLLSPHPQAVGHRHAGQPTTGAQCCLGQPGRGGTSEAGNHPARPSDYCRCSLSLWIREQGKIPSRSRLRADLAGIVGRCARQRRLVGGPARDRPLAYRPAERPPECSPCAAQRLPGNPCRKRVSALGVTRGSATRRRRHPTPGAPGPEPCRGMELPEIQPPPTAQPRSDRST